MAAFTKSTNPMLRDSVFEKSKNSYGTNIMTINGTTNKVFVLFLILITGAWISWFSGSSLFSSTSALIALLITGIVLAIITSFNPKAAPITSPIYALVEGLLLGIISKMYSSFYNGIVAQAIIISIGIFLLTLFFYKTRIIKVTNKLRMGIVIATMGIALTYVADIVFSFFGTHIPFITDSGLIGIAFSLFVVIIASLNFLLDFDYIERVSQLNAPKYMEWYLGFSIIVTFVWLYLEVLRLLSKIAGRSR
jgi:uncharacterized YccA/Bax inhibitor family protein